ncbi:E3 SUMO-protein ligase RanBP2 isoform X2 [Dendroctonus ponderosae]|uniref:E3 SUMO-protein ligase RanBP2 isoform X2 n=1 Tax=Dendroctonus ponderosae TaxID=77166 RepID=UPI002035F067|nr:E3 SUMO-protein ligase RanBP2 isoform X2 [Dendroctonus ponderosae]
MFRTKQEVDKHVTNSLKRVSNDTERNLRCFSFAKLYFNVGDYEHTVRYVTSYLSVKPKSSEGHALLGKALEKLGKSQGALEAYQTSLLLNPKQDNLVIKVCELLVQDDASLNSASAKHFCQLAQCRDLHNPVVSSLQEKLLSLENKYSNVVTTFLLKELEDRPTDITRRVKLLKHYLGNNNVKEAYKHATDAEERKLGIFENSISWYETFAEVMVKYQQEVRDSEQLTWEFWFIHASVLEKLAGLSLSDLTENVKTTADYVTAVFNFDQSLLKASQNIDLCPDQSLKREFLNHHEAQLNLHLSVLALKQAKQDLLVHKEIQDVILPLLFTAYNTPVPDTQGVWFNNLQEKRRLMVAGWHKEASFRCSQAGNILVGLAKDRRNILIERAKQYSTGLWRTQFFKRMFVKREHLLKLETSFFVSSTVEPVIRLPDYQDLVSYNEVAQLMNPSSLHHHIWLALNYKSLSDFSLKSFDRLQYTVKNLNNCAAETLNVLDIQSFIYCAALCVQSKLKNADSSLTYHHRDRPAVLPVAITGHLGSLRQSKFILAAYKVYKQEYSSDMGDIRLTLVKGIEVIRCVGSHGLDVKLLIDLASIFAERLSSLTKQSEIDANATRAELYWKTALFLLVSLKNEYCVVYPKDRLFELKSNKDLTQDEIAAYIEKAKLFIGLQHMKKKEYEEALHVFDGLKDPYASFYQAQVYKHMADSKTNHSKENVTSEMRSQNIIFLSKARDSLYLTLDRLRDPSQDRNHPLNIELNTELEKIDTLLSRIDPDCANRNECDGMSEENVSDDSVYEQYVSTYTHHQSSFRNIRDVTSKNDTTQMHSTPLKLSIPRQEARPSPERLDAQIRQLIASKDISMNAIIEQNRNMTELQKTLTNEIRGFKEAVNRLAATTSDKVTYDSSIREVKKLVDDLTHSVDDRLQNLTDMVQEMKREFRDMKKDENKLDVDDLCYLDFDDGSAQANINPAVNNWYPKQPQAAAPNLPPYGNPAFYPGVYPLMPYSFGALGLGQPGGLPFMPPPHADPQQLTPVMPGFPGAAYPNLMPQTQPLISSMRAGQAGLNSIPPPQAVQHAEDVPKLSIFGGPPKDLPTPFSASSQVLPAFGASMGASASQANKPGGFGQSGFLGQSLNIFGSAAGAAGAAVSSSSGVSSRAPPVNVVITSSDPLPTYTSVSQPVLSVTIPAQHIKSPSQKPAIRFPITTSAPHNFQILQTMSNTVTAAPSILNVPSFGASNTLLTIASPLAKAQTGSPKVSLQTEADKSNCTPDTSNANLNSSELSNVSSPSVEYDPLPNFQPIVPLPDKVAIITGEETETELFSSRAKLYRFVTENNSNEWKERGIGDLKILFDPKLQTVRILMRRDQVHKVCANHHLSADMELKPFPSSDRAFIWSANDYANEELVVETLAARFKTAQDAKDFADAFSLAKSKLSAKGASDEAQKKPSTVADAPAVTTTPSQPQQANFGGFKFISPPVFKPTDAEVKAAPKVEEVAKEPNQPSPFAGFKFGTLTATKGLFENAPSPVKFAAAVQSPQAAAQKEDDEVEEFVPTAEFKPVIETLPDLVEVKTGEEDAEVLLEQRCKLFRMDTSGEAKEWKERGLGNIRILKEATVRLVMRRDQVHKVCLNHQVLKNMSFKQNAANPKAVLWSAQDFSEGVLTPEVFTARFKTAEMATLFLNTVEQAQQTLDENNQVVGQQSEPATVATVGFGDKFKPAKGSWECKNCYVVNEDESKAKCVACETPKLGQKGDAAVQVQKQEPIQKFSFSVPNTEAKSDSVLSGFGDSFKPKVGSWECKECYVRNEPNSLYCLSCDAPKDDSVPKKEAAAPKGINLDTPGFKFTFGMPAATTTASAPNAPTTTTAFGFGDASSTKTTFSWKLPEASATEATPKLEKFTFGSPQKHDFEFKARSPRRISTGPGDDSDASYAEEEEANVNFKPVIPLPDIVEVKTGEENEEVLYTQRAKLYRFTEGEWKERGLGDVKLLKCLSTGKLRVLMRREKVLKICLNHAVPKDMEYMPKDDDRTWQFHAADFSEGEISHDQFCLRFKNAEVAQEFKKAINDALESLNSSQSITESTLVDKKADQVKETECEVEFVSETQVTAEEIQEAARLGLPPKFMAYRQRADCTCEQCKKDDEYLKVLFVDKPSPKSVGSVFTSANTSLFSTPLGNMGTPSSAGSVFASPSSTSFTFGTPTGNTPLSSKSESIRDLLQKPSIFSSPSLGAVTSDAKITSPALVMAANTASSGNKLPETPAIAPFSVQSSIIKTPSFTFDSLKPQATTGGGFPIQKAPSIFGGSGLTGFGGSPTAAITANIFAPTTKATPSAIDSNAQAPLANSTNLFPTKPTSTFSSTLFQNSSPNIFANPIGKSSNTNIFASPTAPAATTNNIFGNVAASQVSSATSLFGSPAQGNIFSRPPSSGNIFGQTIFGNKTEPKVTEANMSFGLTSTTHFKETDEPVLKCDGNLSFATLADKVAGPETEVSFGGSKKDDAISPFAFLGAGAPVFSSSIPKPNQDNQSRTEDTSRTQEEDSEDVTGDHDPHFEPIIPLPDEIVVCTGEEDETVLFNERAKLFRFDADTKEWKERGIGPFKLLYHPQNETYRLLLRREQVHKVVLNQRITPDFELQPMASSDQAWIWAGMNYDEGTAKLEKLAIKFKNCELSQSFKKCVDGIIPKVVEIQANKSGVSDNIPITVQNLSISSKSDSYDPTNEADEDDDDDDEEDDDDDSVMFTKRCTLSEQVNGQWNHVCIGDLQVYYDSEMYGARISIICDDGEIVSNTIIGANTSMQIKDKECWWTAVEWATVDHLQWRTLKVTFSSTMAAEEFHSNYMEGLNYAQEANIIDALPNDVEGN